MLTDAVDEIVNLLTTNWNSANTDNITPTIKAVYDVKRIGGLTKGKDYVLLYEGRTSIVENSLGGIAHRVETSLSIDIRSFHSRARLFKLLNEVRRILWDAILGTTNYDIIDLHNSGYVDLSDKTIGLWRAVYDIRLLKLNEVRG